MSRNSDMYLEDERWRREQAFAALAAAVSAAGYSATGFAYHPTTRVYTVFVKDGKRLTGATLERAFAGTCYRPCGYGRHGGEWFLMLTWERV